MKSYYIVLITLLAAAGQISATTEQEVIAEAAKQRASGLIPLHQAVCSEQEVVTEAQKKKIRILLAQGADINEQDRYGRTAIWWAAERNFPEIIELLRTAEANVEGSLRQRPLLVAACEGNVKAVECLLRHGANPNAAIDDDGCTALHEAARAECMFYPSTDPKFHKYSPEKLQDYKDVVKLLVAHGATNCIRNKEGLTPSELGRKQQRELYPEVTDFALPEYIESISS